MLPPSCIDRSLVISSVLRPVYLSPVTCYKRDKNVSVKSIITLCSKKWSFQYGKYRSRRLLHFQQDNAPAHRAGATVEFLSRNTPDFISPLLWPRSSPDLNPVEYEVWGVLQQCVYRSRIRDVDHLKQRLIEEWRCFDQNIIDRAIWQWRVRPRACVRANGGHFEHKL